MRVPVPVGTAGECFSPESILCADSCSVPVPSPSPLLLQWHIKDPGHSAKSAGGRFHLNTHTPLTQRCRSELTVSSRHSVGTYQGKELTRNSSGNALVQPSQLAESLWTDPGQRVGLVSASLSPLQKKKKPQAENELSNIGRSHYHHVINIVRAKSQDCPWTTSFEEKHFY